MDYTGSDTTLDIDKSTGQSYGLYTGKLTEFYVLNKIDDCTI